MRPRSRRASRSTPRPPPGASCPDDASPRPSPPRSSSATPSRSTSTLRRAPATPRPTSTRSTSPDPARPRAEPTDDARVRAALASNDPLYFDRLSAEDAERTRWALDRATTLVRRGVEARSLTHVRGARWGRLAAVLLLIGYATFAITRAVVFPKNIALGKPVHPSSRKHNPPDGHELVDGELGTSFGIHTNVEESPSVIIDLQARYWIDSIKVYNRVDGWYDDSLPLVVELSQDGSKWDELARREEHFDASPPWVINGRGKPAQFVRIRVGRKSYLALSEVEVYGKKF
jgi:hypothetical protein